MANSKIVVTGGKVRLTSTVKTTEQIKAAQRGLFIQRKFKTILDKVEIKTWLT